MMKFLLALLLALLPVNSIPIRAEQGGVNSSGPIVILASQFPEQAPTVDGNLSAGEWQTAAHSSLAHGELFFQNDATALYLLFDQTDSGLSPQNMGLITLTFGTTDQVRFQFLTQGNCIQSKSKAGDWNACARSDSTLVSGFGPTRLLAAPHNYWEALISLVEIGTQPDQVVTLDANFLDSINDPVSVRLGSYYLPDPTIVKIKLAKPKAVLLILADQEFLPVLHPFLVYKNLTGMPAFLVSWQKLNLPAQGRDAPERIKRAIAAYARFGGTRYVMLVGDAAHFPVRYIITDQPSDQKSEWAYFSSDYYYADLFIGKSSQLNTWDLNGDGFFGELHGERLTGIVNIDGAGLSPAVAVGRVPAGTINEVQLYINKVMNYEKEAYQTVWARRAVLVATNNWVPDACTTDEEIAAGLEPAGYQVSRLYQPGNPCSSAIAPTPANIHAQLNAGAGFVSYLGHGSVAAWEIPEGELTISGLKDLTNSTGLPIIFSAGCDTARFVNLPPYDAYTDINGVRQPGVNHRQVLGAQKPPQPASLQSQSDLEVSIAQYLLLRSQGGAVAYLGSVTKTQYPAFALDRYFYASLGQGAVTLGDMWLSMVKTFYQQNPPPDNLVKPDWYQVATFQQPWKFHLLGDPSLRIGGVANP